MSNKVANKRDMRFEILRIIAMLLILSCHFVADIGWGLEQQESRLFRAAALAWDQCAGQIGVCLFFY